MSTSAATQEPMTTQRWRTQARAILPSRLVPGGRIPLSGVVSTDIRVSPRARVSGGGRTGGGELRGQHYASRERWRDDIRVKPLQGTQAASRRVSDATSASTSVDNAGHVSVGPSATTTTTVPFTSAAISRTVLPAASIRLSVVSMFDHTQSVVTAPSIWMAGEPKSVVGAR